METRIESNELAHSEGESRTIDAASSTEAKPRKKHVARIASTSLVVSAGVRAGEVIHVGGGGRGE
jgi:hypothetical protein